MKIHSDHPLIRVAYLFADYVPGRTTLCRLFWRTVFVTCVCLIPLAALGGYIFAWIWHTDTFAATMAILVLIAMVFFVHRMEERAKRRKAWLEEHPQPPREPSIVRVAFRAVKERVCPLIEIER